MTDHREVKEMFGRVEAMAGGGQKRDLVDEITNELVRHSVAEEQYLYPPSANTSKAETQSSTERSQTTAGRGTSQATGARVHRRR